MRDILLRSKKIKRLWRAERQLGESLKVWALRTAATEDIWSNVGESLDVWLASKRTRAVRRGSTQL